MKGITEEEILLLIGTLDLVPKAQLQTRSHLSKIPINAKIFLIL